MSQPRIVCANISRSPSDPHARVMDSHGLLRQYLVGTRRHTSGINPEIQRLFPLTGLIETLAQTMLPTYYAESVRFASTPIFERWVLGQIKPGDHLLAGFGYLNRCLERIKSNGGVALLEARNSHPGNLWSLMAEEYSRWDCQLPPVYPKHHMRQQRSVFLADYIFSPAKFVTESFVSRGFPSDRVLDLPYPVDLRMFSPLAQPRPKDRPLTIINTGLLTLRKGTPYLLEAFEMVRKQVPNARLLLTRGMADNFEPLFRKRNWDRLPIEWAGRLPHGELCRRLQSADIFVMPSIEDGFALAVTEAMGCGLPVITTRNTGAVDCVKTGVTGSVVPIRNSAAIADEILGWWEKIRKGEYDARQPRFDPEAISTEAFAKRLVELLRRIGLAGSQ